MIDKDSVQISETNFVSFCVKLQEAVGNGFELVVEGWQCPTFLSHCFVARLERAEPQKKVGRPAKASV